MIYLSIVIPAYNEGRRIGKTLAETFSYLDGLNFESEVLVVDDGSTDGTVAKVMEAADSAMGRLRLIRNPGNRGRDIRFATACCRLEARSFYFTTPTWPF